MISMATDYLKLRKYGDGYYRTSWYDEEGGHHTRSFGRDRRKASARFSRFHAQWRRDPHTRNPNAEAPLTITRAWERFKAHAVAYYRHPDGTPTRETMNIEHAMVPVLELYGELRADQMGAKALKVAREWMIEKNLCLNVINARVRRIRHVWKWLASEELVPASTWHALQSVGALQPGRTPAKITAPVKPVPEEHIWKVCELVPPTVEAMINVQFLTGMRPGEVCGMRPVGLEMTGKVWLYRPEEHKMAFRGKDRVIAIGPKTQAVIKPFLQRDLTAFLFNPRQAQKERFNGARTHRHQPVEPARTTRRLGERYSPNAYAYCVRRACDVQGIPRWSPNQLRHNAATRLRKEFGLDIAQFALGHTRADVTQLYAELDLQKLVSAMERAG